MVSDFTKTFLDIISCNVPNRIVTINDSDAPWITPEVKQAIKKNHRVYSKWKVRGKPDIGKDIVKEVNRDTDLKIEEAKQKYMKDLENKLCDSNTGSNIFWSVVNRLVNNKKTANIPPILENGTFITSFAEKACLFNEYFAAQCQPLDNSSTLPTFHQRTLKKIGNIKVDTSIISSIICKLNINKAHGHDEISVAMLKMAKDEVIYPLKLIFEACMANGKYPSMWKRANVQPVHKKNSRQDKTNYRPISLLPICSKIFEKVLFNSIYKHLDDNNLLSKHQSGFRPADSTINQLLAITHDIYESFESGCETRAMFLDISKAFDKVWYDGLLFKLKQNGIEGELLSVLTDYLSDRHQRVVLNGTHSPWLPLMSGVPQGSVLGPLLFLVYINDLTDNVSSSMKLFADDASLFLRVVDVHMCHQIMKKDLGTITSWAYQWKMKFNPDISKQAIEVIFTQKRSKPYHPPMSFNNVPVKRECDTKHLGVILDDKLNFRKHISEKIKTANKGLGLLKFLSRYATRDKLSLMYKMYVRPHLDYGDVIYHNQLTECMAALESIQYNAALIVSGCWKGTSRDKLYSELGWESLSDRRHFRRLCLYYKIKNNMTPRYLVHLAKNFAQNLTSRFANSFFPYCYHAWKSIDVSLRNASSLGIFKTTFLKTIRPSVNSCFGILDKKGTALLTKLRVDFSDLRAHRFKHKFNCPSPVCKCKLGDETNLHFLLHCSRFSDQRRDLLAKINDLIPNINTFPDEEITKFLLYGDKSFKRDINQTILTATISYILTTKRFNKLEAFSED